jgi:uncharacterized protein
MNDSDGTQANSQGLPTTLARPGGISYLFIPATDTQQSADFYGGVFEWEIDEGRRDHRGFADSTGHVAGAFVTDETPAGERGLVPWVYVEDVDSAAERVRACGGEIVREPSNDGPLRVARFRDPAGNILGLWQQASS